MLRRTMVAVAFALAVVAWPADAQVNQDGLAAFVGKYTDSPIGERNNVYITRKSAMIMTSYFGTVCTVAESGPCDPYQPPIGSMPGAMATIVFWSSDNGELVGELVSANYETDMANGPVHVALLDPNTIEVRYANSRQTYQRLR